MNWEERRLDELGFVGRGKSRHRPRNDPSLYGGDIPFIQTADIAAAPFKIAGYSQTYNEKGLAQSKLWTEQTLCMTIAGENTAKTAILDFPACFPDSIVGFIPDPKQSEIRFVKYALDQMKKQYRAVSKGATQDNLSLAKILAFPILVPPIEEQTRIANALGRYEDLIENNLRRIALLEEAAQQLYKEWFVRFRFPGHEHVPLVDGVPEGWLCSELDEFGVVHKGRNITKSSVKEGTVPVVAGGLKPAYFHNTANTKSPVVTISASGANAGYVAIYLQDIWASDCSYMSVSDNPDIWYWYLNLKNRQAEITAMQQGSAQPHVYPKQLRRLSVNLPPEGLLRDFSEVVSSNFLLIQKLQNQNRQLERARDLLLPKLMSGEITV